MARIGTHLNYANVIATIAIFIALGGSSYAAVKITGNNVKNGTLTGADIKNSSVTGADIRTHAINSDNVANGSLLAEDFKSGQLPAGAQGSKGDTGVAGPQGSKGDPGANGQDGAPGADGKDATNLWAVVNSDGTLNRGSHVVSASKVNYGGTTTGSYQVIFDRDVTSCVYMGTLGGANTAFSEGQITTFPRNGNVNGVFIFTYDSAAVRADRLFQVAVLC